MKIVFHGMNAGSFAGGFASLLEGSHDIAVLPDALETAADKATYSAADAVIGVRLDATCPPLPALRLFQVVGAGYMISQETGDVATYVKLLRVAMLIPVVFTIAYTGSRSEPIGARLRRAIPTFLVGFVVLVLANSFLSVPAVVSDWVSTVSSWCLVAAISALGMKTSFGSLAKVGWTPLVAMVVETLWIGGLCLAAILAFR